MAVLLIANYVDGVGGISVQVKLLRDKLLNEGLDCDILSTKGSLIKRIKAFLQLIKTGKKFDVFHIHACSGTGFFPAVVGVLTGKILRRRIVLTYHGGGAENFFRKRKKLVCAILKKTDCNIVLSGFIGKVFDQLQIPYTVIPNIMELDQLHVRKRDNLLPHFISIRSFTETYNIECTLRAFHYFQEKYPEGTLTLLGDGPLRASLEKFVLDNHIQNVSFVGQVSNDRIYDYLAQADIMLSSSRFDNMPVSILEGFNAGLLVIASNVGGVPYMIQDGINGLLFPNDDDIGLFRKMLWAITHQEESHRMIELARLDLWNYSWTKIKPLLLSAYSI